MGSSKMGGTLFGVSIRRIIVFWGLHWGPLILGNYHMACQKKNGADGGDGPIVEQCRSTQTKRSLGDKHGKSGVLSLNLNHYP